MTDTVRSAARVLDLIELLSAETAGLSLSNIAERLAMPKSSTLMLLRTLVVRGYASRTEGDRYRITPDFRAGAFGWRTVPFANLLALAEPVLEALTDELSESTTFAVIGEDGEARLLANVVAKAEVRWDSDMSRPIPLFCTAVGRALLSGLSAEDQRRHLEAHPRQAITAQTIVDLDELIEIIARARHDGYVVVREEFALGGTGVATPIFDGCGVPVAALNVSCVSSRFTDKRKAIVGALLRGKAEIESKLASLSPRRAVASRTPEDALP